MEKYESEEYELLLAWLMHHPAQLHPVIGTTNKVRIKKIRQSNWNSNGKIDWFSLLVASKGHNMH